VADTPRIEELKRRVQSDPASIAFAALAEEYRRAGRFGEAIETCTTGLVRHPSYLSAHVTLGRALIEVGRLPEARAELEYVLKLAPENLAAIRGLAEIHHRIGDEHTEHVEAIVEPTASSPAARAPIEKHEAEPAPIPRIALKVRTEGQNQALDATTPVEEQRRPQAPTPVVTSGLDDRAESPVSSPVLPAVPRPVLPTLNARTLESSSPAESHVASPRPVDPALAGLEEFLNAIIRARSHRASIR
jgi:tetratricopeptide (TPR) repeat protein